MEKQSKATDFELQSKPQNPETKPKLRDAEKQSKTRAELAQLVAKEMTEGGFPTEPADVIIIPSGEAGTDILRVGQWRVGGAHHGRKVEPGRVEKRDAIASALSETHRLRIGGDRAVLEERTLSELIASEAARHGHKVTVSFRRYGSPGEIVQNWSGTTMLEGTQEECAPMAPYLLALYRHFDLKTT